MNVGQLNQRVKVYKPAFEMDEVLGTNAPSNDELICELWANIAPRTGSMLSGRDAGTILSQTTHAITVRSRGDISPDCYLVWADRFGIEHRFDIDYVRPPVNDNYMMIYVQEQV